MRCTACNSKEVTVVGFHAGEGTTYRYCRNCETGVWEAEGKSVAKERILEVASRIEPSRRRAA
jgi:hypothetical protein